MKTESRCVPFWVAAAMLAVFSLVTCDARSSGEKASGSTRSPDNTAAPPNAEVFFPTMPEQDAVPTALAGGELALDEQGCLGITRNADPGPRDLVPIWPSTFEPDTSGGEVRILDGERVVAQVGKAVVMGGGETSAKVLRGNDLMGEQELRELSERCPDYYWFVGEGRAYQATPLAPRPLRQIPYRTWSA